MMKIGRSFVIIGMGCVLSQLAVAGPVNWDKAAQLLHEQSVAAARAYDARQAVKRVQEEANKKKGAELYTFYLEKAAKDPLTNPWKYKK